MGSSLMEALPWLEGSAGLDHGCRQETSGFTHGCWWLEYSRCSAHSPFGDLINGKFSRLDRLQPLGAPGVAGNSTYWCRDPAPAAHARAGDWRRYRDAGRTPRCPVAFRSGVPGLAWPLVVVQPRG